MDILKKYVHEFLKGFPVDFLKKQRKEFVEKSLKEFLKKKFVVISSGFSKRIPRIDSKGIPDGVSTETHGYLPVKVPGELC